MLVGTWGSMVVDTRGSIVLDNIEPDASLNDRDWP